MARTVSNPLPQFITSPDLGAVFVTELRLYADNLSKQAADADGSDLIWGVRVNTVLNAADQIEMYHTRVR